MQEPRSGRWAGGGPEHSLLGAAITGRCLELGLSMNIVNLPTMATTAWFHDKVPNKPADVATFAAIVRDLDAGSLTAADLHRIISGGNGAEALIKSIEELKEKAAARRR